MTKEQVQDHLELMNSFSVEEMEGLMTPTEESFRADRLEEYLERKRVWILEFTEEEFLEDFGDFETYLANWFDDYVSEEDLPEDYHL